MFLNKFLNKYRNSSIKSKIFFMTVIGIVTGFILLYFTMYLFLPKLYSTYKVKTLENRINNFIDSVSNEEYSDVYKVLDKFTFENGLIVNIEDEYGKPIYSSYREGFNFAKKPSVYVDPSENKEFRELDKNDFFMKKAFYFKSIDKNCTLTVKAHIVVDYETKRLLKVFFPTIIVIIIAISITIAYFYSRIISKPLISMNKKAKRMAELDLNQRFNLKGNDEMAQLGMSLNIMCENLKRNIDSLEKANIKLRADIDIEREIEKERKEFIGTISHELKSPITIISGQLEGMIYNIGKYKDRDKYLRETYDVSKEMEKLVLEILELTKQDKDNFRLC